jgi:hypothetical protein
MRSQKARIALALLIAHICSLSYAREVEPRPFAPRPVSSQAVDSSSHVRINEALGNIPLSFQANLGQTDPNAKFLAKSRNFSIQLANNTVVFSFAGNESAGAGADTQGKSKSTTELRLVSGSPDCEMEGLDELPGKVNYLVGTDPSRWVTSVPTYAKVQCRGVYRGIDWVFYGNQRQVEHDFVVHPGADPGLIELELDSVDRIDLDEAGAAIINLIHGQLRFTRPSLYQIVNGSKKEIKGGFVLRGKRRVGFRVGEFDPEHALVIDPILTYSSFVGTAELRKGSLRVALDAARNIYVSAIPGPTPAALFNVTKLTPDASQILYSTDVGSFGPGRAVRGIGVDASGDAVIVGYIESPGLPVVNAMQPTFGGGVGTGDGFVFKLNYVQQLSHFECFSIDANDNGVALIVGGNVLTIVILETRKISRVLQ